MNRIVRIMPVEQRKINAKSYSILFAGFRQFTNNIFFERRIGNIIRRISSWS